MDETDLKKRDMPKTRKAFNDLDNGIPANKKRFYFSPSNRKKLLAMLNKKYGRDFSEMLEKHIVDGWYNKPEFLRELKGIYGIEVLEAVAEFYCKQARSHWRRNRGNDGNEGGTIHGLIKLLWVPLKRDGWEYTYTETGEGVLMNCTKCPQYDAAKEFGYEEEWYYFLCFQDAYIAEGYNPKMGFKMTRTLMQGHECCNHFYFMKDED